MIFWIDLFYFFIGGVALLLSVMGLWFTAIMPGIDRWSKNFFLSYFAVLMLCCSFGLTEMVMYYYPVSIAAVYSVLLPESIFLSMPIPMLTVYLLRCCGERMRSSKVFHLVLFLSALYFVMLASVMFSDSIIYFTPDGRYHPGPLYPIFLLPLLAIMLLNLAVAIKYRTQLSP